MTREEEVEMLGREIQELNEINATLLAACERALTFITEDVAERDILLAAIAKAKGTQS